MIFIWYENNLTIDVIVRDGYLQRVAVQPPHLK